MVKAELNKLARTRRGMSLVEILVVMVILIVGILAIVRIFPGGFASINFTGDVTLANALFKKNLDYITKYRENLPAGVVALDPATGNILFNIPDAQRNHALKWPPNGGPTAPDDPRFSDINWFRLVRGEQVKLPAPTPVLFNNSETASLYHVLFAPIYFEDPLPTPQQPSRS